MSALPYSLARRLLFRLDPETAHDLTLDWLTRGQNTPLQYLWQQAFVDDPVTVAGLQFPNRIGLAAGLDKNARCIDALGAIGFGFVEVGTVTPQPQSGSQKPRMFRLPEAEAIINRLGFNNRGLDAFVRNVEQSRLRRRKAPMVLGLNIGKNATTPIERASDDYIAALEGVYPHADYIVVNVSSPNTKNLRTLQTDEALDALLGILAARREVLCDLHGRRKPLFVKIAPDLDDEQVAVVADVMHRHGMDGVIASNTTLSRSAVQGLPHGEEGGGLSGTPVRSASNRVIAAFRARLGKGFPIIGVGGVMCGADAVTKLEAGADLVQVYTGLVYRGPTLVPEAAKAMRDARR
ncbi:quinone-dependent dihydroorotate dehydrogenase [Xylophilus sp. GOD-11R]|uniref:quinone-dependent dihydroorotate dehydrogenase n=1 Tax=Xylophilus sp. GOD-11R TaxID=3089814 RepID=UPI00298D40EE|nr:quinone-dependent dihydroorotate dehydrogenase [Xylophilus sp. GOD-11R]WPB57155.1 quinone-dependent dihydroorotate dehydrogenase [Xylophilus sp. GOD-11R]